MTTPIDEEEVVVSLRLQPVMARPEGWRGRSGGLIAAGLVGFIVVGIALGAAFDSGRPASSAAAVAPSEPPVAISPAASRRPNPTARPRLPPLPRVQVIGGEIPTERRLVYASGLQVLDLATGELTTPARPYEDIVLALRTDEVVCACMTRLSPSGDVPTASVVLRFERMNTSGGMMVEREVTTFDGIVEVPEMDLGFTMAAALSADDRFLFILTASRRTPAWTVELRQVDVASGELFASTVLDELPIDAGGLEPTASAQSASATARPAGGPPDGVYIWANALARSPDGSRLAATIAYSVVRGAIWTSEYRELLVPLTDGQPGPAAPLETVSEMASNAWCVGPPEFIDDELLVQVCSSPDGPLGTDALHVRRLPTNGESIDDVPLRATPGDGTYQLAITVDRGRRAVLSWDPVHHSLARVSVDDGAMVGQEVAPEMLPDVVPNNNRGYFGAEPGLVLSPDGDRLYAIGFGFGPSDNGTPTGVWVFDAETLDLIDHWAPTAMFTSIAISADGRFVYAAGANGFDVAGNPAFWPSSITVYDAQTGEIQVIYGSVSSDAWVSFRVRP